MNAEPGGPDSSQTELETAPLRSLIDSVEVPPLVTTSIVLKQFVFVFDSKVGTDFLLTTSFPVGETLFHGPKKKVLPPGRAMPPSPFRPCLANLNQEFFSWPSPLVRT